MRLNEGFEVGLEVGGLVSPSRVGDEVIGGRDGRPVGVLVGLLVVGLRVGCPDGSEVGWEDGCRDGRADG